MKIVCSPKGIVDKDRPRQGIMDIADAGFLDQGVICGLSEDETDVWGDAACEYRIVEPIVEDVEKDALWTVNREYYLSLLDEARTHNVKILLKNMCRNVGGHLIRGVCSDAAEAVAWVDALNTEAGEARFGFCVDMGVCNVCGQDLNEYITPLGNRVKAVILQDGNGSEAQALLPFTAAYKKTLRTDWLGLIRGLRKIGFDGILILNLEDTVSATSPLLRPALLRYAKQVADYLCWQIGIETTLARYESRVLFGAGNMCWNYLKCYGEKYPPLYTCDNNPHLWGSRLDGLEIHNPEDLKKLDKDTAVFICNIYYREIEQQLRKMGLPNPIVYFNDEYLPQFHFERLTDEGRK